jgi:uridylate kinase
MKISLSLGGSLLTGKNKEPTIQLTPDSYRRYAETLKELHTQGHEIMAVCGGGKPARHFIDVSKQLGGSRDVQDLLGIKASHVNALLMMSALGSHADQSRIYQRASDLNYAQPGKILVGGGYRPSSSTDYRAVIFADKMGADLIINATDVPGVYDRNPKKHPDAVKLKELTYDQLETIIKENTRQAPGEYGLFDLKAVKRARKAGIPVVFIDGTDPQEIKRAVDGTHGGSTVKE